MAECSCEPPTTPVVSQPGISGMATLIVGSGIAVLNLIDTLSIMVDEERGRAAMVRRKLSTGWMDGAMTMSIIMHVAALALTRHLTTYHVFIIWLHGLTFQATHNVAMLGVVRNYKRGGRWVRLLRLFLMAVNMILSVAVGVHIIAAVRAGVERQGVPIQCGMRTAPWHKKAVQSIVGTIAAQLLSFCSYIVVIITMCTDTYRRREKKIRVFGVFLMAILACGSIFRIFWATQHDGPGFDMDKGDSTWGYGQWFTVAMAVWPIYGVLEVRLGDSYTKFLEPEEKDEPGWWQRPIEDDSRGDITPIMPAWRPNGPGQGTGDQWPHHGRCA